MIGTRVAAPLSALVLWAGAAVLYLCLLLVNARMFGLDSDDVKWFGYPPALVITLIICAMNVFVVGLEIVRHYMFRLRQARVEDVLKEFARMNEPSSPIIRRLLQERGLM